MLTLIHSRGLTFIEGRLYAPKYTLELKNLEIFNSVNSCIINEGAPLRKRDYEHLKLSGWLGLDIRMDNPKKAIGLCDQTLLIVLGSRVHLI